MIEFGSGVSIVSIKEVEKKLKNSDEAFSEKVFTPREFKYCSSKRNSAEHFAARLAAKEACLRALGLARKPGLFQRIEVIRKPSGQPTLSVNKNVLDGTTWKGAQCDLSMAHERDAAIAFVLFSRPI